MFNLQDCIEKIKELFSEIKKKNLLISMLLVFMTLCAVVALIFQVTGKKEPKTVEEPRKLVLDQALLVPDGPSVPNEYITSRKTPEKWSVAEVEKWFTLPDNEEVKKLGETNDKIVDEIIGAAP